ncbi:MAG: hypothetical protein OEY79_02030 [Anaplasmataceae bacterium]|nr:hypothetical protein [Candidatus Heimdallarchaeota archaeon]MDH5796304.1 hypothetical protein [Anaplasmataceae bacterium]
MSTKNDVINDTDISDDKINTKKDDIIDDPLKKNNDSTSTSGGFKIGDRVVYSAHKGIGDITGIKEEVYNGQVIPMYVIYFSKERMTMLIPISSASSKDNRLRKVNSKKYIVDQIIGVLTDESLVVDNQSVWNKRVIEYESKMNSGDLIKIAELVKELYKNDTDAHYSYSERNIYEYAIDRLSCEIAMIYGVKEATAKRRIIMIMNGEANSIIATDSPMYKKIDEDCSMTEEDIGHSLMDDLNINEVSNKIFDNDFSSNLDYINEIIKDEDDLVE